MEQYKEKLNKFDIIEVKPLSKPIDVILYMDVVYNYTSKYQLKRKNRKEKYKKIFQNE